MTDMDRFNLRLGNCLEVLANLPAESVDSVVTDPPYHLTSIVKRFGKAGSAPARASRGFMGKEWDGGDVAFRPETWAAVMRVMKPGAHLLAFGGSRGYHRMACAIEDAGFEIRDCIMWLYGSGFPKSLDVSKAIDKMAGAEREVVGQSANGIAGGTGLHAGLENSYRFKSEFAITAPATESAQQWQGWGSALKPAYEPVVVARKPFRGTVAENVLKYGTGAINIDGCRVGSEGGTPRSGQAPYAESGWRTGHEIVGLNAGRWPANVIHDGSPEVLAGFPLQNGVVGARREGGDKSIFSGGGHSQSEKQRVVGGIKDTGSAARFFYCAKASKRDRDEGPPSGKRNLHPTVKPTDLMRYLCRLVTPPGGVVLDPFMGSGSTGKAAMLEGFRFVGIEREAEYLEIAEARIQAALYGGGIDGVSDIVDSILELNK